MRKISLVLLSIGAVLALSIYWQGPATAQDTQMEGPAGPVYPGGDPTTGWGNWWFGQRIAGTYLCYFEWEDNPYDPATPMIITIDPHGEIVGTGADAFGRGLPPEFCSLRSNAHWTWERTGCREIASRHLMFLYDCSDEGYGTLTYIIRTTGAWEFDDDLEGFSADLTAELFSPEQLTGPELRGPLTPNTDEDPDGWAWPAGIIKGKRLHVD